VCLGAYDEAAKVAVSEKLRISVSLMQKGELKKMLYAVVVVFINFV
jgi:hypothetical protein